MPTTCDSNIYSVCLKTYARIRYTCTLFVIYIYTFTTDRAENYWPWCLTMEISVCVCVLLSHGISWSSDSNECWERRERERRREKERGIKKSSARFWLPNYAFSGSLQGCLFYGKSQLWKIKRVYLEAFYFFYLSPVSREVESTFRVFFLLICSVICCPINWPAVYERETEKEKERGERKR